MAAVERLHRLLRLIEVLQSGLVLNATQLASHCGVSRRTIFRDLALLQESGIALRYDERRQGYSLPARTFVPSTDLTLDEILSLLVLCHDLGSHDGGIPFQRGAQSAAVKLLSSLPPHFRDSVGELADLISVRIAPRNALPESQSWYELLTQALAARRQVRIRYGSLTPGEGEISTLLSPYHVLFHQRSWYVIARSSLHRAVRTFHLGRIVHAETLPTKYVIPKRFSLDRHFGNAWTMIRGPKDHEVVVRFQPLVAQNVAEVQWHKTQKLHWNEDGTLDYRVTVSGLTEIRWWILGYGDQAEVLNPPALRDEIRRHVKVMAATYRRKSSG